MPIHASRMIALALATSCACSIAASSGAAAQNRFELLNADAIAAVTGMKVYTIRDNQIAACYSVFAIDPPDAPSGLPAQEPPPPPTPEQYEQERVAQALKDAIANHDRQVAELQKRSLTWGVEYGTERERIEDEYQRAVRQVLPAVYPSAQIAPGWPTSTREELNAAVRQALAQAEAPDRATLSRIDERLEYLLRRMTASARLAVTGPVGCPPPTGRPGR